MMAIGTVFGKMTEKAFNSEWSELENSPHLVKLYRQRAILYLKMCTDNRVSAVSARKQSKKLCSACLEAEYAERNGIEILPEKR